MHASRSEIFIAFLASGVMVVQAAWRSFPPSVAVPVQQSWLRNRTNGLLAPSHAQKYNRFVQATCVSNRKPKSPKNKKFPMKQPYFLLSTTRLSNLRKKICVISLSELQCQCMTRTLAVLRTHSKLATQRCTFGVSSPLKTPIFKIETSF